MCVRGQWYIKGFDKFSERESERERGGERQQRRYNEKKDWHIDEPVKQAENLRERVRENGEGE